MAISASGLVDNAELIFGIDGRPHGTRANSPRVRSR
jgi:hypothetical protein